MKVQAKCGCGATLDLVPESDRMYGNGTPSTYENQRVTETFDKWNEAHRHCSEFISRPREVRIPIFEREARVSDPHNIEPGPTVETVPGLETAA